MNTTAKQEPIVWARDVFKSFRDVKAVNGINLKVFPGQYMAVLGPNGAGKTTLVEMIEGIQKPDNGEITIKGMPWKGHQKELNMILGISLQETYFVEKLTVKETLILFASLYKLPGSRVDEIMDIVNLKEKEKAYVKNLSGGQRQRLSLGISLLNHPEILLLDEPTTGLDPNARREIWNLLLKLKEKKQTSLILTTHYMEEAEHLCDQIVIIDRGKILARGTLGELLENCDVNELIKVSFETSPPFGLAGLPGVQKVNPCEDGKKFTLQVNKIIDTLPSLIAASVDSNTKIISLESRTMTLDDLFISMTGRHLVS